MRVIIYKDTQKSAYIQNIYWVYVDYISWLSYERTFSVPSLLLDVFFGLTFRELTPIVVREYNILKYEIHVLITEEGWHDYHRSYHKQDATEKHHNTLGDVALVVVHLDVYLQS